MQRHAERILIVDDLDSNLRLLRNLLTRHHFVVSEAWDGLSALASVDDEPPDLVLLDVAMPGMSGLEVCQLLKHDPSTRLIPVVLLTGLDDQEVKIAGLELGADDFITKPFDTEQLLARVRSLVRLKRYTDDLDSAEAVLISLAQVIEARDECTSGHCQRLADYAMRMGRELSLAPEDIATLRRGGLMHDIGKVAVPDAILLKRGTLTEEERRIMERHTVVGDEICSGMRMLRPVCPIIRHHHERQDGSGYPDKLRGSAVPILAQIVGLVDVYDALATDRPYRTALAPRMAFDVLREETTRGLHDPTLVAVLEHVVLIEPRPAA